MVISGKSEVADQIFVDFYIFGVCLNPGRTKWLFCYLFKFMQMMIREPFFELHLFHFHCEPQWFKQGPKANDEIIISCRFDLEMYECKKCI